MKRKDFITYADFEKIDLRTGRILKAQTFPKAKKPAYQLWIDFGEIGVLKSSAQITDLYNLETLIGMQVIAVVNFPPKQIADFISECLILGIVSDTGTEVVLLTTERKTPNGGRIA